MALHLLNRYKKIVASGMLCCFALSAHAELHPGDRAPDFKAQASLAGKEFTFSLAESLKKGPVVVYFYPAAFTPGCSIEAHDFAAAIDQYKALDATVIGVSHDTIATLNEFSVKECSNKFSVAADTDQHIMKAYQAISSLSSSHASRTSYVISPDNKIIYSYSSMLPNEHVKNTLNALKKWSLENKHTKH